MSLELTENKSNIGSGAVNDLVFTILSCNRTVVVDPSAISWGAIGNRLAISRRLVGDCILSVCFFIQKLCNFLEIGRQPIGDWAAISRRQKSVSGLSATGRRSVANQSDDLSATCRRPTKTFIRSIWSQRGFTCSNQNLLATKSSLQPSATGRRPVGDLLAITLQPPCDHPKYWSQWGRRPVASYVWPGLKLWPHELFLPGICFNEILLKIEKKIVVQREVFKKFSAKWWPFCSGLNMLTTERTHGDSYIT